MASWLILDSLYCPEQYFASHLDSYGHYLREYGERVNQVPWNCFPDGLPRNDFDGTPDVAFLLDQYERAAHLECRIKVGQVAAVTKMMPWEVRKPDGSPAFDLVVSSIPAMVEQARAAGCRAAYQPLCFDTRALTCGMGVKKDIDCLFVGTVDGNHRKRSRVLAELEGLVTVAPPTFGREYHRLLARAKTTINVHAEWAEGARNALRIYETMGHGGLCVTDGRTNGVPGWELESDVHQSIADAINDFDHGFAEEAQGEILREDTYVQRVPELVDLVRAL